MATVFSALVLIMPFVGMVCSHIADETPAVWTDAVAYDYR